MDMINLRSHTWRLYSTYYAVRFGYPWATTPYGRFKAADFASTVQNRPEWEHSIRQEVKNCKGLFVDVGANIGFYSVLAAKNGNQVIALEPNPKAYACLRENILENKVRNLVSTIKAAAWSYNGKVRLVQNGYTDMTKIVHGDGMTDAYTLDTVLKYWQPAMIKIDAEDSEDEVLKGATETFSCHPKVIFEAWDETRAEKRMRLFPEGYTFKRLDATNYLAS